MAVIFGENPSMARHSNASYATHITVSTMPRTRHPRQGTGQPSGQRANVQRTDGERYVLSSPSRNWPTEKTSSVLPTMRKILRMTDPCCCKSRTRIRRTAVFPTIRARDLAEIARASHRCESTKMRSLKIRLAAKSPSQEVEMEAPTQQHIHHRRLTGTHQLSMLMDRKWGSCQK